MSKKYMLELDFNIGDIVYLITDRDQSERIVTGMFITSLGITYYLSCGTDETRHYSIEISHNKNFKLSN